MLMEVGRKRSETGVHQTTSTELYSTPALLTGTRRVSAERLGHARNVAPAQCRYFRAGFRLAGGLLRPLAAPVSELHYLRALQVCARPIRENGEQISVECIPGGARGMRRTQCAGIASAAARLARLPWGSCSVFVRTAEP